MCVSVHTPLPPAYVLTSNAAGQKPLLDRGRVTLGVT